MGVLILGRSYVVDKLIEYASSIFFADLVVYAGTCRLDNAGRIFAISRPYIGQL